LNRKTRGVNDGSRIATAPPDMLIRTVEGRLTFWPPCMEQRYGFTSEQALGRTSHQLLKTIFPQALNDIEETLQRQSNWSGGLIHHHADGRAIIVIGHWYLQRTADGQDPIVTELHSAVAGNQVADLIAVLAHRLSEPLTAVNNYINAAQRVLDHGWPDRDSLRTALAQATSQIARGAEGVKLMRDLANELRSTD